MAAVAIQCGLPGAWVCCPWIAAGLAPLAMRAGEANGRIRCDTACMIGHILNTDTGGADVAGKIFINYRRDDAKAEAARLRDRLAQAFGAANVFMDVDNLLAAGQFSVTVGEYRACVRAGGCRPPEWDEPSSKYNIKTGSDDHYKKLGEALTGDRYPIVGVSWDDAQAYAKWLSGKTGKSYRLLSEAEREYVTRAGTAAPFWWGSSISTEQANYDGNYTYAGGQKGEYRQRTVPVKSFQPNPWGLYQVHGNVWDWVEDCWNDNYPYPVLLPSRIRSRMGAH